jgi:metallo-beta-lactamase class B
MVSAFGQTFERLRTQRADVFLANHDSLFDLHAKRARQLAGDANAFVDPDELQTLNTSMARAFEAELARQQSAAN